jgi:hypothetical protein
MAYRSASVGVLYFGAEEIPQKRSPNAKPWERIEIRKVYGCWFTSGRSENRDIGSVDLMTG